MCSTGACFGFSGCGGAAALERENYLAHFDLRAFLNLDFFDRASHRRRNFHDRLVGFQFHHRLAFGDFRSRRNHEPHQVALIDPADPDGIRWASTVCRAAGAAGCAPRAYADFRQKKDGTVKVLLQP